MVVGGMTASIVSLNLKLAIGVGEGIANIMDVLNAIMPGYPATWNFLFWFTGYLKRNKSYNYTFGIHSSKYCWFCCGIF